MATVGYALSALLFIAIVALLCLTFRVLLDALALYHHAGMRRIHHDRKATR